MRSCWSRREWGRRVPPGRGMLWPLSRKRHSGQSVINILSIMNHIGASEKVGLLHDPDEVFLGYFTVSVAVCLLNHFLEFVVCHGFS